MQISSSTDVCTIVPGLLSLQHFARAQPVWSLAQQPENSGRG